jgi:ferredoxin-nitrite reductase
LNDRVDELLQEDLLRRHSPFPAPFERGVVACTGSEFCRFAVVETKIRAVQWAKELDRRYATRFGGRNGARSGEPIVRMHFSGCPASCAQPQVADIGLRGETAHVGDEIVEAVDIGLGGSLGEDAAFGDWVEGAMPVEHVADALGRVVERYFLERSPDERFHEWARRSPEAALRSTLGRRLDNDADDGTNRPIAGEEIQK